MLYIKQDSSDALRCRKSQQYKESALTRAATPAGAGNPTNIQIWGMQRVYHVLLPSVKETRKMKNNTKNHQTNSRDTLATDVIAQAKERAEHWHKEAVKEHNRVNRWRCLWGVTFVILLVVLLSVFL